MTPRNCTASPGGGGEGIVGFQTGTKAEQRCESGTGLSTHGRTSLRDAPLSGHIGPFLPRREADLQILSTQLELSKICDYYD